MRINALYQNGVFRPTQPVDLPEACEVEMEVRPVEAKPVNGLDAIYALLEARFDAGDESETERLGPSTG